MVLLHCSWHLRCFIYLCTYPDLEWYTLLLNNIFLTFTLYDIIHTLFRLSSYKFCSCSPNKDSSLREPKKFDIMMIRRHCLLLIQPCHEYVVKSFFHIILVNISTIPASIDCKLDTYSSLLRTFYMNEICSRHIHVLQWSILVSWDIQVVPVITCGEMSSASVHVLALVHSSIGLNILDFI